MTRALHVPVVHQMAPQSHPFSNPLTYWIALTICLLLAAGCDSPVPDPGGNGDGGNGDGGNGDPTAQVGDCLSCHTNEELLKAVARDEPPPVESTGEG
ncbi:MAG: hypothetical protein DHS20C16_05240 [Phycisphaerae bacterium]|nr:MAG: hypothetical protein DHS20C16_05240 [Phycisphaerae bacterium]